MRPFPIAAAAVCLIAGLYGQGSPALPRGTYANFHTSMGDFVVRLHDDVAPRTVKHFLELAEAKQATQNRDGAWGNRRFYDGLEFHRVVRNFMIQTGELGGGATCGLPPMKDEIDPKPGFTEAGVLGMANTNQPNTANCEIFVTVAPAPFLQGRYTKFGDVVSGLDVVKRISEVPVQGERPVTPVIIRKLTIERR